MKKLIVIAGMSFMRQRKPVPDPYYYRFAYPACKRFSVTTILSEACPQT
jgi:hypothetical protein